MQENLLDCRRSGQEDYLILLRHPPLITFGRRAQPEHLLLPAAELTRRGIESASAGRGGDVTYHDPGQLVGYPIIDLERLGRDLHRYLRLLEEVLIRTLSAFGLPGERIVGKTGVWVEGAKIASIGIGVRRWVSWHGFALNIAADVSGFAAIVPCGLHGVRMTSVECLLGKTVSREGVEAAVINAFADVFALQHAGEYEYPCPEKT